MHMTAATAALHNATAALQGAALLLDGNATSGVALPLIVSTSPSNDTVQRAVEVAKALGAALVQGDDQVAKAASALHSVAALVNQSLTDAHDLKQLVNATAVVAHELGRERDLVVRQGV